MAVEVSYLFRLFFDTVISRILLMQTLQADVHQSINKTVLNDTIYSPSVTETVELAKA